MHALVPAAAGRGIFIWLLFRTITRAVGWPITLAIFVVIAVTAMYMRQRRSS